MSLKAIEMQIALPRTQDAGKLQNEVNERSHIMNSQAQVAVQKEQELKSNVVIKKDELAEAKWQGKQDSNQSSQQGFKQEKRGKEDNVEINHPYKGKIIDFTG